MRPCRPTTGVPAGRGWAWRGCCGPTRPREFFDELRSLALKTFGPAQLAAQTFLPLGGVQGVVVFGSWAARHAGIPGHDPHDLDVLLIGEPSQIAANRAADELGRRLDLPVGLTVVSESEWEHDAVASWPRSRQGLT